LSDGLPDERIAPAERTAAAARVRTRRRRQVPANGLASNEAQLAPLPPLRVSGVVVRKADLIEALRLYVPGLLDVQVTEDGEQFWLMLGQGANHEYPPA